MKSSTLTTILLLLAVACLSFSHLVNGVAINETGDPADASAILDVESSTQGALLPRMTSIERESISNPALGLMIFNTTRKCLEYYTGTHWTSDTPAGTIMAFGGDSFGIPDGWLLCDGSTVSQADYADLSDAIGANWGSGGPGMFMLPDLRGVFLRGANLSVSPAVDPDVATRIGGSTVERIGSVQSDATSMPDSIFTTDLQGLHAHVLITSGTGTGSGIYIPEIGSNYNLSRTTSPPTTRSSGPSGEHSHTISGGDNETRPVNAYVNYIIKY